MLVKADRCAGCACCRSGRLARGLHFIFGTWMLIRSGSGAWRTSASRTDCAAGFRFVLAARMLSSTSSGLTSESSGARRSCLFRARMLAGAGPRGSRAPHRTAMLLHLVRNTIRHLCVRVLRGFTFAFLSIMILHLVANLRVFHAFPAMVDFVGAKTIDDFRRMLWIRLILDPRRNQPKSISL